MVDEKVCMPADQMLNEIIFDRRSPDFELKIFKKVSLLIKKINQLASGIKQFSRNSKNYVLPEKQM